MTLASDLVQLLCGACLVGLAAAGIMSINSSASFGVSWCTPADQKICWKGKQNSDLSTLLYGVMVFCLSFVGLVGLFRVKGWASQLQPWKNLSIYVLIVGAVSLGASANTGLLFGALVMFFGFVMFLMAFIGNVAHGRLTFTSFRAPSVLVKLIQIVGFLAGIGGSAAAILGMVENGGSGSLLSWCSKSSTSECWSGGRNNDYSFYAFCCAIFLVDLGAAVACLKVQGWLSFLYPFENLGFFCCFVGWCTMSVAANTGLLFGAALIACGGFFLLFWLFTATQSGYERF